MEAGQDRIIPFTRWLSAVIVPFLIVAAVLLYGFPRNTEELFAWTIQPPLTAMFLASAYIGGIRYFVGVIHETRWHRVHHGFPAVFVFASLAGIATVLHWDRFHFGHISFIAWAVLYVTTPFLVVGAWLANRRADTGAAGPGDSAVPGPARIGLAVVGGCSLVAGLVLVVFPAPFLESWAWNLTPLTARIVGAVLTLPGLVNLSMLRDARWSAFRLLYQSQLVSLAFILGALLLAHDDIQWGRPATPIVVGGLAATAVAYLALYVSCERRARPR